MCNQKESGLWVFADRDVHTDLRLSILLSSNTRFFYKKIDMEYTRIVRERGHRVAWPS